MRDIEGFSQYRNADDVVSVPGTKWLGEAPAALTRGTGVAGADEMRPKGGYAKQAILRKILPTGQSTQEMCMSFDFKSGATGDLVIGFLPEAWYPARLSGNTETPLAFFVEILGNAVSLWHGVPTSASGATMNHLKLGASTTVAANADIHLDAHFKVSGVASKAVLYINGQKVVDETFNADRLSNGHQAQGIALVAANGRKTNYVGTAKPIGNLLVYTPDADGFAFPVGNVDVKTYAPSAVLGAPADDTTAVQITTDTYQSYAMPAGSIPTGAEVLAAVAHVRLRGGGGTAAANADVVLNIDGADLKIADASIAPALPTRLFSVPLTAAQATVENINAAAFKMRSKK